MRAAADYVMDNGPRTDQERWENQDGFSPNTIAAEIAGLVCAADIARANGDNARAHAYEAKADHWQQTVEQWTATDNSPYYAPTPYYLRVTKDGDPNDGSTYEIGDNFPHPVDERRVVDQSFLGLVLLGVKPFDDQTVLNSLAVGDQVLGVDSPNGTLWHRFTYDGYGEQRDGGDVGHLRLRRAPDARPRLAAAERRARRVRAARRPGRSAGAGDDRRDGQRRVDAAGAGLGRAPADRPAGQRLRRGHALGDAAGVDARAVHPPRRGRSTRASRSSARPIVACRYTGEEC